MNVLNNNFLMWQLIKYCVWAIILNFSISGRAQSNSPTASTDSVTDSSVIQTMLIVMSNTNLDVIDKDLHWDYESSLITFAVEKPYAYISNKKLRGIVDAFSIKDDKLAPVFLYLQKTSDEIYEFWKIEPILGWNQVFFENNILGFYQVGRIYIFVDKSVKRDIKTINRVRKKFDIASDTVYQAMNIDPALMFDLKHLPQKASLLF